jgi:hypothetical protein
MKKTSKIIAASAISLGLVFGGASAAIATTEYPAGGVWDYGTGGPYIYSFFQHPTLVHGSSVKNCLGNLTRSVLKPAGQSAQAVRQDGCPLSIDYAYYRFS